MPAVAGADSFELGLEVFSANHVEASVPYFEDAASRDGAGADVYAWLAYAYFRTGRAREADSTARIALSIEPCHAFAHDVLALNFNDQLHRWEGSDPDSSWWHVARAVACDSTDGNAWMTVWIGALKRGDRPLERRACRRMLEDGFFTGPLRAYARWLLARLPENSVLLVNGDMDTYPGMALQEIEGFRPDVAIVNVSLLNLDWYRRVVRDRFGVPMPYGPDALDRLDWEYDDADNWVSPAAQVERGWREMLRKGLLPRPLTYATTVQLEKLPDTTRHLVLEGAFLRALPWSTGADVDTAEIRRSLSGLRAEDFTGPWVSPRDRSPVRGVGTHLLVSNIVNAALQYAAACMPEHPEPSLAMLDWAVDFGRRAEIDPKVQAWVEKCRDEFALHMPSR